MDAAICLMRFSFTYGILTLGEFTILLFVNARRILLEAEAAAFRLGASAVVGDIGLG